MKKQLLLILLGAICIAPAMAQKPLYTGAWGVQTYTFRKSFPKGVAATLDSIKGMGFTEVEGAAGNVSVEEFKKLCDERGLKIPSTGAGYEELVKDPMTIVKNAKVLGSKYVMCAWIPQNIKRKRTDFLLSRAWF
jgi:sugar phosphate isomerase/epimerase